LDSECSTIGNIKHIQKIIQDPQKWKKFESIYSNPSEILKINSLQKKLIQNCFDLLKVDGILVYCTCSFLNCENEDVVSWLLENNEDSLLVNIFNHSCLNNLNHEEGDLLGTIKFSPLVSNTNGFFVSKIKKINILEKQIIL
jgi:16S rRNA C967 or C1407 C5-methylase (RsmB/RsmF family)